MPATRTQLAQATLILGGVPEVAAYPPDWAETRSGEIEFYARRGALLVRDADAARVLEALPRVLGDRQRELDVRRTGVGATLIRFRGAGEDDVPDVIRRLAGFEDTVGIEVRPDHLLYVCAHSCAAIEAVSVPVDAPPVPRVQTGQDASHPRCGHGAGVSVRLLDTGLVAEAAKPDPVWIAARPWMAGVTGDLEETYVPGNAPQLAQDAGHGTFAAGSVRVTAPEAEVHVVNAVALLPSKDGSEMIGAAFESDLAALIRSELLGSPGKGGGVVPDVLGINFAGRTLDDAPPLALATLHENLLQHLGELLVMAPAGNDGDDRKNWPAAFDWVVSVGGLAQDWRSRASWSCHGRTVDVHAPGDHLVNAFATGRYTCRWEPSVGEVRHHEGTAAWSGTSFAMPLVAGLVASRMSQTGQSSRRAWHDLQAFADAHAVPGTGPVLLPGEGC